MEDVLDRARDLARDGRCLDAIDLLTADNRQHRRAAVERLLVQLRRDAFAELDRPERTEPWPPLLDSHADDGPGTSGTSTARSGPTGGIPEIAADQLDADAVRNSVLGHGSLIVRQLLDPAQVSILADATRASIAAAARFHDGAPTEETSPWFDPVVTRTDHGESRPGRVWVRNGGGCLAADSPRALFELIEVFRSAGIVDVVRDYLGERPALSVRKTTLRDVPPDSGSGWHQDGAFLGRGVRTLNVWVALSPCGEHAPSLDMVPARLAELAPTGTEGAHFGWSVSDAVANDVAARATDGVGPVRLAFEAGDAILFDEMNLHRTGVSPTMTAHRLAIEAWFFAPSSYPMEQLPVVV